MAKFDVRPESFSYSTTIAIQWGDMDALGHVNNSRYLTFFETARCEYFRQFGLFCEGGENGPVVAHAEIRYRGQVAYPATLRIHIRSTAVRESSFRVEYAVYEEESGRFIADGATLIVWVDFSAGKRMALPEVWAEHLVELVR